MTKLALGSDLHLGHLNVLKMRPRFETIEEHNETIVENFCMGVNKRDSLMLLGDVAHTVEGLQLIKRIKCVKKTLLLGNHCTDQKVPLWMYLEVFDEIHALHSRRNVWFSHAPIHPNVMRGKIANIHGHTHDQMIENPEYTFNGKEMVQDKRYINVCVEQTDYKPISFADAMSRVIKW